MSDAAMAEAQRRHKAIDRIVWHCVALPLETVEQLAAHVTDLSAQLLAPAAPANPEPLPEPPVVAGVAELPSLPRG